jgi:hypothetical protein
MSISYKRKPVWGRDIRILGSVILHLFWTPLASCIRFDLYQREL